MATFASLKAKVVAKVQAQTDYFASDAVYQYEPQPAEVLKDPFAVVVASGNDNDFGSTSENRRTFAFSIRIFVARAGTESATETTLQSIIDALINAFDQDYTLGGEAISVLAAPSSWGYIQMDKEYRTADIVIKARTWFDVTP